MSIILLSSSTQKDVELYLQEKIEEFNQSINTKVYIEAKEILNKWFGEENNQIVKPTFEEVKTEIINDYEEISASLLVRFDQQQIKKYWNSCKVYIRFPTLSITNDVLPPHDMKDLWVRFNIDKEFGVFGLKGVRSSLSYKEALVGYHHSHLPSIIPSSATRPPIFQNFCTGSGEIVQVMKVLSLDGFDNINFTLFCLHLKNYVVWESLEGVPHITYDSLSIGTASRRLSGRSGSSNNGHDGDDVIQSLPSISNNTLRRVVDHLKDLFITGVNPNIIQGSIQFRDIATPIIVNNEVMLEPTDELSIALATVITNFSISDIAVCNINDTRSLLCKKLANGAYIPLNPSRNSRPTIVEPTRPIFEFKGEKIFLKIEGLAENLLPSNTDNNQNTTIYAHSSIVQGFCKSFSSDFTEACFRFEKVIKENSLENLLQTTGADLLPML